MLQLFSKNQFLSTLLFFPVIIVLHLSVFTRESVYTITSNSGGYIGNMVVEWFESSSMLGGFLTCVMVFIQVVLINRICIINKLSNRITLYAGMVYMVLTMMFPRLLVFSAAVLSSTCILVAITSLMHTYKIRNAPLHVFNTGFWIAVAALCYPSISIYLLCGFISFTILRRFRSVEGLQYLIGFSIPIFWALVGVYVWGDFDNFIALQFTQQLGLPNINYNRSLGSFIPVIIYGILCIYALLNYNQYLKKKEMQAQKKITALFWVLVFSGLSAIITQQLDMTHLYFLAIPLSYFLSESLVLMNNKPVGELIMWVFILIGCVFQYGVVF